MIQVSVVDFWGEKSPLTLFYMNKYIFIVLLSFTISCIHKEKGIDYFNGDKLSLIKVDSIHFKLDSMSNSRNPHSFFHKWNGKEVFSFLNQNNNSIYIYDIQTAELIENLKFSIEGPDGVGKLSSYYISNEDSLYLYSYGQALLSIANSNRKIFKRINIESDLMSVRPEVNSSRPLGIISKNLIFNSWGSEREYYNNDTFPENSFLFLNLDSYLKSYQIAYPDTYKGSIWGVQFFQIYHDFNFNDSLLILSYPIDNSLYVYDFKTGNLEKKLKNNYLNLNVNPLSDRLGKFTVDILEEVNHLMMQEYYSFIKYDSYNNMYYRVINHPVPKVTIESGDELKKSFGPFSVLIFDSEFNFKDIIKFPPYEYYIQSIFFHDGKIYIEKIQTYNEDLLVFDVFKLK